MRQTLLLFLLAGCIGMNTSLMGRGFKLPPHRKYVKIPVEIQHNIILLPVRINNSFEMNFILDTGVRTTILTEPVVAGFLDLDSLSTVPVRGLGSGEVINAALAEGVDISLPGIEGTDLRLVILPEGVISYSGMFGKPVYGIIGFDLFRQFVVEINYAQEFIKVHLPFKYKPNRKSVAIPIDIRQGKPYVNASLIDHRGKNIESHWLVDIGASQAVSLFDNDLPLPDPAIDAFLGMGLSGHVYGKLGRVQGFELGGFRLNDVIAGYPDPEALNLFEDSESWYGNLGAEIISRFHVAFDYARGIMYLRKNAQYKSKFNYNISGLELLTVGENFDEYVIAYVRPNSPAEEAGIEVNDKILWVNGFTADQLNMDELYTALSKREGKIISLRLERNNKVVRVKFKLSAEI